VLASSLHFPRLYNINSVYIIMSETTCVGSSCEACATRAVQAKKRADTNFTMLLSLVPALAFSFASQAGLL
jgi:hypothetical protein